MTDKHLFLYLNTGGGHYAPAKALANHITGVSTHKVRVRLADGFQGVNPIIKSVIENGYRHSQSKAVRVYEVLYALHKWKPIA